MSVHAGQEAEYIRRHQPIWQDLERTLLEHGVHTYSIFLDRATNHLFGYVEFESEAQWHAVAATDVCRRWWAHMCDLMPANPDNSPVSVELEEVFHIERRTFPGSGIRDPLEAGNWKLATTKIEVIVQTVADAVAATDGGADRLEVVRAMRDGGLTPPLSVVDAIKHATSLPLRVMVRENAGFETSEAEIEAMRAAAWEFTKLDVDGLVVGFAKSGELSLAEFERVIEAAPGVPITFHRAFDALTDPLAAIDRLSASRRIDAILTSGGEGPAHERCARLRDYVARARSRLTIIAGGGVDEESFGLLVKDGAVQWIHVGRAARDGIDAEGPVSSTSVRRLRDLANDPGSR